MGDVGPRRAGASPTREILRKVFAENDVSYEDDHFSFEDVTIEPKPVGGPVPFWYCGGTPASARLAVEYCDGWMPGRIVAGDDRAARRRRCAKLSAEAGKADADGRGHPADLDRARPRGGAGGRQRRRACSPGRTRRQVRGSSRRPGASRRPRTSRAQLIAGTPDEVVEEVQEFEEVGVEHLVFDFRFKFDRWFEQIELLGNEVLPRVR